MYGNYWKVLETTKHYLKNKQAPETTKGVLFGGGPSLKTTRGVCEQLKPKNQPKPKTFKN